MKAYRTADYIKFYNYYYIRITSVTIIIHINLFLKKTSILQMHAHQYF